MIEERARLARDLHDSVTQAVFSMHLMTNTAQVQYRRGSDALEGTLARIRAVAQDTLSEMRALIYELRPTTLEEEGLGKALEKLVAAVQVRVDVPITFMSATDPRPERAAEHAIFRIVQESLANAAKYARATRIAVSMTQDGGRLRVQVSDDGIGFDPSLTPAPSRDGGRGGMGLRSMRERAVAAGITLHIETAPGAGCRIIIEAPVPAPASG